MSGAVPTARAAILLGAAALVAALVPAAVGVALVLAAVALVVVDAIVTGAPPAATRAAPTVLARGVPSALTVTVDRGSPVQPGTDALTVLADGRLVGVRRGRHLLPPLLVTASGRLGLVRRTWPVLGEHAITIYPDVLLARRLTRSVLLRRPDVTEGSLRGPLGLGTSFESLREYAPDDDVRLVNWRATARVGRPISNQFRVEQSRTVHLVLDTGRLMGGTVGDRTRLDAALDALTAVAQAADALGDTCGLIAYDDGIRRRTPPRTGGGTPAVAAAYDLEARPVDSDHDLAFAGIPGKRAVVMVFTDVLDEAAAATLLAAVPVLARRHALLLCTTTDPDLAAVTAADPTTLDGAALAVGAAALLTDRRRTAHLLRRSGATVVEAAPARLPAAAVAAYLRVKSTGRA